MTAGLTLEVVTVGLVMAGLAFSCIAIMLCAWDPGNHVDSSHDTNDVELERHRINLQMERNSCLRAIIHLSTCDPDDCSIFETDECSCGKQAFLDELRQRWREIDEELERIS